MRSSLKDHSLKEFYRRSVLITSSANSPRSFQTPLAVISIMTALRTTLLNLFDARSGGCKHLSDCSKICKIDRDMRFGTSKTPFQIRVLGPLNFEAVRICERIRA